MESLNSLTIEQIQPKELVAVLSDDGEVSFVERKRAMDPKNDLKRIIIGVSMTAFDENGNEYALLQRRSGKKKEFPNYLTAAATGHINPEDMTDGKLDFTKAMNREIKEETGLELENQIQLVSNFDVTEDNADEVAVRKHVVIGNVKVPLSQFKDALVNEEVSGFEIIPVDNLVSLVRDPALQNENNRLTPVTVQTLSRLIDSGFFGSKYVREP